MYRFNYSVNEVSSQYDRDIHNKLNKFRCYEQAYNNKVRRETKSKFYKLMTVPVLLDGSETWILTWEQNSAVRMKFLEVKRYTISDRHNYVDTRTELKSFCYHTSRIDKYEKNGGST